MSFDITCHWPADAAPIPHGRNAWVRDQLLASFPDLVETPLDLNGVAEHVGVPRDQVLNHMCEYEVDDPTCRYFGAIVTIWNSGVVVELPSSPGIPHSDAVDRVSPILDALAEMGIAVPTRAQIISEYQKQTGYVNRVVDILNGDAPQSS